jgi:hypothetical protein
MEWNVFRTVRMDGFDGCMVVDVIDSFIFIALILFFPWITLCFGVFFFCSKEWRVLFIILGLKALVRTLLNVFFTI